MVSRPYKCPLCHATFRNESGRNWHIAHRHEIPNAFDILGKDYDSKLMTLQEDNKLLKEKVGDLERKLSQAEIEILKEQTEKLEETARVIRLNNDIQTMAMAIAKRDIIIKEQLGIMMPNPFESKNKVKPH